MLKAAGVGIYLDDYGTGYTSLDYLYRFPVQVLKLDRSVISSLDNGQVQLVAGVRAMAAALDLEVLAEGVETREQRDLLVQIGIRYGQGYLFSRALPAAEYADTVLGPQHPVPLKAKGTCTSEADAVQAGYVPAPRSGAEVVCDGNP